MEDDKNVSEEEITLLNQNVEGLEKEKKSLVTEMEILQANYNRIIYSNSWFITKPLRALREYITRNSLTERKTISRLLIRFGLFVFAFIIMAVYLFPMKDVYGGSGDAVETWKVVTTFFSAKPYTSYVMYKGLMVVLPNLVFYNLSLLFKLDQFFFVKIFDCACFAYITTIGLPYFFSYIFKKKIENYKIFIMTIILYFGLKINFSFISVDFPSILVMLLVVNSVIRIKVREKKVPVIYYVYMGIIFSMCMLFSGQYAPAAVCVALFIFFVLIIPMLKKKEMGMRILAVVVCFAVGYSVMKAADNYFVKTRVDPARAAGVWIPTGNDLLKYGLTAALLDYKYPANIPDNRGTAILNLEHVNIPNLELGTGAFSLKHDVKLIIEHPVDYTTQWLNKLFMGISVDDNRTSVIYLLFSYTLLFLALLTLKRNCNKVKDVFNPRTLLVLALITPSLVPCLLRVEMRYYMSIQLLIAGGALLSDTLWNGIAGFKNFVIQRTVKEKLPEVTCGDIKISHAFVGYIAFVMLCFMLFAVQYELLGPSPSILFKF